MSENATSKISMDELDEYPEVTQADFDRAIFRQRLEPVDKKQRITIMLDANIINYFKALAGKRGYQTLINDALKNVVSSDPEEQSKLENLLRKVVREELASIEYTR